MLQKRIITLLMLAALLLPTLILFVPQASALSGSELQAGRIMDDAVFFNPGTMNVPQIQEFLNAKVPSCDSSGQQTIYDSAYGDTVTRAVYSQRRGVSTPFICLKDFRQDTVAKPGEAGLCSGYTIANQSAAEIIYNVSQSCGINPKVLIVLLQKEQSLVADDWPWPVQYRSATGYGCPDTAPCDAEYYGFFNQVYNAARVFKIYARGDWGSYKKESNNTVYFNPGPCQTRDGSGNCTLYYGRFGTSPDIQYCGATSVYIQNQATAGLYNYTPYQPNTAALNNLYGTGDICSAYGNRNFWRLYNDWFGSTLACESPTIGATTLGTYNPSGYFYQRHCHTPGPANTTFNFGNSNWIPLSGDWNGDGFFSPGAYDPTTGRFYLRNLNSDGPAEVAFQYGNIGWIPIAGDWNGNGYWSVGLYDPATSTFYLKDFNGDGGADYTFNFGNSDWKPIVGDWDRNGSSTVGVYDTARAIYYLNDQLDSSSADKAFPYGNGGWTPLAGDWDGNGYWSIGAYDPNAAVFYLRNLNSGGSADIAVQYGNVGWTPIVGDWDGR